MEEVSQRAQRRKPLSVVAIEALRRSTEPKGAAAIVSSRRAVVGRSVRPHEGQDQKTPAFTLSGRGGRKG